MKAESITMKMNCPFPTESDFHWTNCVLVKSDFELIRAESRMVNEQVVIRKMETQTENYWAKYIEYALAPD